MSDEQTKQAEQLVEAAKGLDHKDDAHWTKKGGPDCNVLSEKAGFKVKREFASQVLQNFNREAAKATAEMIQQPDTPPADPEPTTTPDVAFEDAADIPPEDGAEFIGADPAKPGSDVTVEIPVEGTQSGLGLGWRK